MSVEVMNMALSPLLIKQILGLPDEALDTSGIKLHLWKVYVFKGSGVLNISHRKLPEYRVLEPGENGYYYLPIGVYVIRYKEYVKIPDNCIGIVLPRSSLLRMGATIYSAVWDPGYEGQGIGLLTVFNPYGLNILKGAHIAQLVLFKVEGKPVLYQGVYKGERG